jgi:hypothetical protein
MMRGEGVPPPPPPPHPFLHLLLGSYSKTIKLFALHLECLLRVKEGFSKNFVIIEWRS